MPDTEPTSPTPPTFTPGSVVQLRSGGPLMTVDHAAKEGSPYHPGVFCCWIDGTGRRQGEWFGPHLLRRAAAPSPHPGSCLSLRETARRTDGKVV